jgi:hypothetical protein
LRGARADAGDIAKGSLRLALAAAQAMEGDRETVSLIANLLDEMQNGIVAVEDAGFVFLTIDVEDFFLLGNGGEGLIDDLQ